MEKMDRRDFMIKSAIAGAALGLGSVKPAGAAQSGVKIGVFSKHLQWLNYKDTADAVTEIGWDGIECPVRPKGHVLPERVEEDLPKMVEALKNNNLEMFMATVSFHDLAEPHARTILSTLKKTGVKLYRIGGWKYDLDKPIPDQMIKIKEQLQAIADINIELGLCAAFQNHSGTQYVGAPLWDLYDMIKDMDINAIGSAFDIGHSTVEGGYVWPVNARLMRPLTKIVIVKDFTWGKDKKGRWRANWGPLGDGMVNKDFFAMLKETGYNGSIIQHFEWKVEGRTEKEVQKNSLKAMKKDCETLKFWLSDVGLR